MSSVIDPLELLTNKGDRQPSFLSQIWNPMMCATLGAGLAVFLNFAYRKPIFSGIQKHVGLGVGGLVVGKYIDQKRDEYLAKRDAMLRHYIELHPDDFPPIQRKKYSEILEPWVPIR